jgi:hypothetical protein
MTLNLVTLDTRVARMFHCSASRILGSLEQAMSYILRSGRVANDRIKYFAAGKGGCRAGPEPAVCGQGISVK